jgi:metallo-beta-lactamase family protein
VRAGFRGAVFSTYATRDLCSLMLRDSARIMESDVEYLNRKLDREHKPPIEPIYSVADATESLRAFTSMDYERPMFIAPGVRLTFYDAGHILGSALCALDIEEESRTRRLLFTGDLGRAGLPILRDPQTVPDVDFLITESTYGARLHGTVAEAEERLRQVVNATYARGGKVIIPAFSVGRTQEVVYALHRLCNAGQIPTLPIFVDSPLAVNATDVFRLHPECYDQETHDFVLRNEDPFGFNQLHYLRQVEESKALNARAEPMVIISASGMCEAGRILHHLKNNIEDARHTILFVGFQAEHTLGRRIVDGQEEVSIFGETYRVRAHVESIDGYSAHADRDELLGYMARLRPGRIRQAFLVHGDLEAAEALAPELRRLGMASTLVPTLGQKVEL